MCRPKTVSSADHRQQPLAGRDHHERQDLAQQEFVRRNARDVDLQDGLLLAFLGHGQRGQQGGKHRDAQHEDARAVELRRIAAGVVPEPHLRADQRGARRGAGIPVEGVGDLVGVACTMRAVLESVASTSNCTCVFAPRARSRPKFRE